MSSMSADAARALVQSYNRAEWDRFEALFAPDAIYDEVGTGRRARGGPEIVEMFKGWKRAMPDSEGAVNDAVDAGNTAVLEVTWTGRFTGPLTTPEGELAPTGKRQTSRSCIVVRFEANVAKECRQYFDSMSLMRQLGVPPATL